MKRVPVKSSNLAAVGYDERNKTLEIEFNSGGIYQYFEVEKTIFDGLMNAESHGRFFNQNIKGQYNFICLT